MTKQKWFWLKLANMDEISDLKSQHSIANLLRQNMLYGIKSLSPLMTHVEREK